KHRDADGVVREYWMVEVNYKHLDGTVQRVRRRSPVQTRKGAEEHERQIRNALQDGTFEKEENKTEDKTTAQPTIPTVAEFCSDFLTTYVEVNNKPSEVAQKKLIFKYHLEPVLGSIPLDQVAIEIEPFKATLRKKNLKAKTVNNIITVLSKMLRYAEERKVI